MISTLRSLKVIGRLLAYFYVTKAFLVKKQIFFFHINESQALGTLSEKPLEHKNKNLLYREKLVRKTTQQANVTDVLTRLWGQIRSNSAKL